jgi:ribonuclease-3
LRFLRKLIPFSGPDKALKQYVFHTTHLVPHHILFYKQAFSHRSRRHQSHENNERLEFLGDSILNAIIAEYLYSKFPYKEEGYLTELRARIVQRKHLNLLANDMNMQEHLDYEKGSINLAQSDVLGDAFEAFIGAVYLDHGYAKTRHFILEHIVKSMLDMDKLADEDTNYKGRIYTHIQKEGQSIDFKVESSENNGKQTIFKIALIIDDKVVGRGQGFSKKEAEQKAAKEGITTLGL